MNPAVRTLAPLFFGWSLYAFSANYRIDTVAGSSNVGDGGPALHAPLRDGESIAVDHAGNLYVADAGDHRIRKITPDGTISTLAGTGIAGFSGDDGPARLAQLNLPYGVASDAAGNLYIADLGNNRIRRISPNGVISSLPGTFRSPRNVLADAQGNLYVSEFDGNRVRRINSDGTVVTVAGTGASGHSGDYGLAALATLNSPAGLALDSSSALYIADSGNAQIRKVAGGTITTVLGNGVPGSSSPMQLNLPTGVALDAFGNLYVADSANHRIRKLAISGTVSTIALPARDIAFDSSSNLLIASGEHLTKLLVSGAIATIAGDGSYLFRGDGGPATQARLNQPNAVAVDKAGALWIADTGNSRIRSVSAAGLITTATSTLHAPAALSLDPAGNLLVADPPAAVIWQLAATSATQSLAAVAGNGFQSFSGDGIPALSSALSLPSGVVAAPAGGFYIADTANNRVRRVNTGSFLATVAGLDRGGFNGDGIALGASLDGPTALALDSAGTLYIADTGNNRIRKLTPDGQLFTVAGGPTAALALNHPRGLTLDPAGTLWIADTGNHRILTLSPSGTVAVAAGVGTPGFAGDGADALSAQFFSPSGLAVDSTGNIVVADTGNNRIRILIAPPPAVTEVVTSSYSAVNAASLQGGPAAPCSLITIFGPDTATATVSFDGIPAPLVSSVAGQATVQVTCGATPPSTALVLSSPSGTLWHSAIPVAAAAPALFALNAGSGQALALNSDSTANSEANPAARGSVFSLFATGFGLATNPGGVLVGSTAANILFLGDAPGLIGITQINIQLPAALSGVQPVTVFSANTPSQTAVTVAISVN